MSIVQGTKARGIELRAINHLLRKLGLVLVIAVETDLDTKSTSHTRLWIERVRSYDRRTQAVQA